MFSKPEGPHLTAEQARDLDDQFLSSRPQAYFRARIASLLTPGPPVPGLTAGLGAEMAAALGVPELEESLHVTERDRELQVSVDAFTLRHHAAESLVRLYHALEVATPDEGAPRCLWAAIVDGPRQTADLVAEASEHLHSDHGRETFWTLMLPPEVADVALEERQQLDQAVTVCGQWLQQALRLLRREDLSLDAAHNKVKHGLAVRAEDQELIRFITRGPDDDDTIPRSALHGEQVVPLIDGGSLTFLSRPSKNGGLELAAVNSRPALVLAETWLLAAVHGAMFALAARRHFAGRDDVETPLLQPLPMGPAPTVLLGERLIGLRSPLTTPRKGGGDPRSAALAWTNHTQDLHVDYGGGRRSVRVVDDAETPDD